MTVNCIFAKATGVVEITVYLQGSTAYSVTGIVEVKVEIVSVRTTLKTYLPDTAPAAVTVSCVLVAVTKLGAAGKVIA